MPPPNETESNMWAQEQKDRDRAMREHNDAMMRRFTFFGLILTGLTITISIWAVVDSGKNAEKAIAAQVQAMQLDERPYIRTEFDGMGEEALNPSKRDLKSGPVDGFIDVTPHVRLKPFGRSPAVGIDVVVKCVIDSSPPTLPAPSDDDVRLAFLTAGDDAFVYCGGHLLDDDANHVISITGLIIYHDYAKNEYRTPFCYYYNYDPRAKEAFEKKRVGGCPLRADFK